MTYVPPSSNIPWWQHLTNYTPNASVQSRVSPYNTLDTAAPYEGARFVGSPSGMFDAGSASGAARLGAYTPGVAGLEAAPGVGAEGATSLAARLRGMAGAGAENFGLTPSGLLDSAKAPFLAEGLGGTLKALAGRVGGGIGVDTAFQTAAPVVGALANRVVPGTGGAASSAMGDMGTGAGLGFTVAGPPGAVVGTLAGGAKALGDSVSDFENIGSYKDLQEKYSNIVWNLPENVRKKFAAQAIAQHNNPKLSLEQHIQKLAGITAKAAAWKPSKSSSSGGSGNLIDPATARRLQIQNAMAAAINPIADRIQAQGPAFAGAVTNIPGVPTSLGQYDADQRNFYAGTTANALRGAAYAQPLIDDINSAVAQQQQYLQQINAAQTSGNSNISDLLASSGIKKKK